MASACLASDPLRVSDFANAGLQGWETHSFAGETRYSVVRGDGRTAVRAESEGTASARIRRLPVDLTATPYLEWSWRVVRPLTGLDERSKGGDDYAARVYVVRSGGALFWRTRAVSYVWSGSEPAGTRWPNAYTDQACMVAVRGPGDPVDRWLTERRDVREDFRECFGLDVTEIDAVAIMTDTDNSGEGASALYGDLTFHPD